MLAGREWMPGPPRGTLTLLFTDIESSADLAEQFGLAFEQALDEHFRLLREALGQWRGHEVGTAGDSIFAVFPFASDAVRFAVEAQQRLADCDWPALVP